VVIDPKSDEGLAVSARLLASADVVTHNFPPESARRFGLVWGELHAARPALVVGRVSSFGTSGLLAGAPAYDLVAQARAALLTAHASRGDDVPVRAGGIPMADLTAGFLLASGVLAALVRARETGRGDLVDVSLLAAALAVQLQDLVWLVGEAGADDVALADRAHLHARADEIASGVALNPYCRCFEAADGFLAVACLNLTQRRAFLGLFGLEDPTIDAPDLVPADAGVRAAKKEVAAAVADAFSRRSVGEWLDRLESAGVPCGRVQQRESVYADPLVRAERLIGDVEQDGLGRVRLLAPFVRVGGQVAATLPAPSLGAHTDAVRAELR
jgi:crotonobetainyl-CoA:carnitine CoA-transferase CaiB-like acyl-CoA transferase